MLDDNQNKFVNRKNLKVLLEVEWCKNEEFTKLEHTIFRKCANAAYLSP